MTTDLNQARQALARDGYVVLEDALPPAETAAFERDLAPTFAATPFCEGDFYGWRTKRFGRLLVRSPRAGALVLHDQVLGLVQSALGRACDTLQLNLTQAIEIHPGERAQFPHRDEDMWAGAKGDIEYLVNVMWPLTPFRAENGATRLWPGTHNEGTVHEPEGDGLALEADPGSAILFLGSTLHGGGANISPCPRRGVLISYCLGWLKPYENQWLAYPPAVARDFPAELAALVGYRQHRPNLGNYEGRCPSILLEDQVPDHLAARDALRPDPGRRRRRRPCARGVT